MSLASRGAGPAKLISRPARCSESIAQVRACSAAIPLLDFHILPLFQNGKEHFVASSKEHFVASRTA
jgi:hypothetical protein